MEAVIVSITPQLAQEWLGTNHKNRNLSSLVVHRYADTMRAGKWLVHNQGIGFDSRGNLVDGQHRLQAVIEANAAVEMLVVRGVPSKAADVVDCGKRRTPADTLAMEGCQNATYVAGAARLLYHYEAGTMHQITDPRLRLTNLGVLGVWNDHPGLEYSAAVGGRRTAKLLPPSVGTFCHYLFFRLDADDANRFFIALVDGTALLKGSAILALRNRLIDNRSSKASLPAIELAALMIKAWNLWRKKSSFRSLRWRSADSAGGGSEDFPEAT